MKMSQLKKKGYNYVISQQISGHSDISCEFSDWNLFGKSEPELNIVTYTRH